MLSEVRDSVNELRRSIVKSSRSVVASQLSSDCYKSFGGGYFKDDIPDFSKTDPKVYDAVSRHLDNFEEKICQNLSQSKWQEKEYCQPETDNLLKNVSRHFFSTGIDITCVREYSFSELDFQTFRVKNSTVDHVVMLGKEDSAKEDGTPILPVECKNLNWTFAGGELWKPKGQALVYLTGVVEAYSK